MMELIGHQEEHIQFPKTGHLDLELRPQLYPLAENIPPYSDTSNTYNGASWTAGTYAEYR